jgi:cytochrome P450
MTRRAAGDQELGGHQIPADATVIVCQYTTQRDERWWSSAERFDPDRFAGKVDNFAYFPFSRGPRTCRGMHLAMLEMRLIVASIVARYRLELSDTPVEPKAFFSLRTKNGIWLRLTRRD